MKIRTLKVDKNVKPEDTKTTEHGWPDVTCMPITNDESLLTFPATVTQHPEWRKERKPWGHPSYPYQSLHSSIEMHYLYRTVFHMGLDVRRDLRWEEGILCANLGVFRGSTTAAMAQGAKDAGAGKVYGVDLFESAPLLENLTIEQLEAVFEKRGIEKYVEFCKGFTSDWAGKLSHVRFNFIFIDADHHYESCLQDFQLWSPLVAEGGLLAFHDTQFSTVDRVVREELDDWELVDHVHSIKSFRRRPGPPKTESSDPAARRGRQHTQRRNT